ncbi:MAG TPA: acetate/propionate family kinase [Candidatus Acidoferrales bacterium]|nr:acetate/propionate family kinase [Candidatus Acidoferrales bacterium]
MHEPVILVINSGSSSLKFGLYVNRDGEEHPLVEGEAEGIGQSNGKLELRDSNGRILRSEGAAFASQADALDRAAQWLGERSFGAPAAIGHRVVHGGPRLVAHQAITSAVLKKLKDSVHFAPLHIPLSLELIRAAQERYPKVPQFACFDTAFHNTMPEEAARFALPDELFAEGIRRYGFHGLSYESIVHQLRLAGNLPTRTIVAHLGNGASLAAIKNGRSVDTTMGLTPTGGIPMATRTGDLDPGVILYLQRVKGADADSLERLLNRDSGLTALSGGKSDMRDLQAAAAKGDSRARLAIEIFCRSIRKVIAAYATVLGGADLVVFTGGIGEHSSQVRANVCDGLGILGILIDSGRNQRNERTISADNSNVQVAVVPSEEDRQIARHCRSMI